MSRLLIAVIVLTVRFATAEAADAPWLCYAVAQAPHGPSTLCWPAGSGDEAAPAGAPLVGWRAAGRRAAPRTVEVVNRLGSTRVRVKGGGRFLLAPSAGGSPALACRAARARDGTRTGPRLVLRDAHGEHIVALRRPERLCEPADASLPQLLCYRATSRGGTRSDALAVSTRRGTQRVRVGGLRALCVPTLRPGTSRPPDLPADAADPTPPPEPPSTPAPPAPPVTPPSTLAPPAAPVVPPSDPGSPTGPPDGPGDGAGSPGVTLRLAPSTLTVVAGDRPQFTATAFLDAGGSEDWTARVLWRSSDETVAVVGGSPDSPGGAFVEAAGPGTAVISAIDPATGATSDPGGSATLTVLWPLEKLTMAPHAVARRLGSSESFTVTGHFTGGFTRNLTQRVVYASSAPAVVSAPNAPGNRSRVNALAPGVATISATDPLSGISTTVSSNDATVRVAGALFAIAIITRGDGGYPVALRPGESRNFTAVGHYLDGTVKNLTQSCEWTSGDPAIAAYAGGSTFSAVSAGRAFIECRDAATGIFATSELDVVGTLARIEVSGDWPPLRPGKPRSLTAIGVYEPFADLCCSGRRNVTQEVLWESRDPGVAIATNEEGNRSRIVAVGGGAARIFATDPTTGVTSPDLVLPSFGQLTGLELDQCTFQNLLPVGAEVSPCKVRGVFEGGGFDLRRFAPDEWAYESSDPSVAEVLPDGQHIRTGAAGFFTLTVRHLPTRIVSNAVSFTVQGDLVRILLDPPSARRAIGEVESLTAQGEYAPGLTYLLTQQLQYASSDESVVVATNQPGNRSLLRTVGAGTATVTATDPATGISASMTVEVLPGTIERVTIEPPTTLIVAGLSRELTATGHYPDGRTINVTQQVTWTSLDPAVAEAPNSPGGRSEVRGLAPGTARIVATHPSGASSHDTADDATITVVPITGVSLTPETRTGRAGTSVRYTLVGILPDGSTVNLTQRATYWTDDPSVALALNDQGDRSALRLLAPGTTTVAASAWGGTLIDFVLGTRTDTATLSVTDAIP